MAKYVLNNDTEEDIDAEEVLSILNQMGATDPDLNKTLKLAVQLHRVDQRDAMLIQQQEIIRTLQKQAKGRDDGTDSEASGEDFHGGSEPDQAQGTDSNSGE